MQPLADELRGGTAYVLEVSLPKIMKLDGENISAYRMLYRYNIVHIEQILYY